MVGSMCVCDGNSDGSVVGGGIVDVDVGVVET